MSSNSDLPSIDGHHDTDEFPLQLIPLGGLDEVGMNCTLLGWRGRFVLVDCGSMFPDRSQPGVEFVIPNLHTIARYYPRLEGVILTHGHEDHIGAVCHLLRAVGTLSIWATRFTLELLRPRLEAEDLRSRATLLTIDAGETIEAIGISIEAIGNTHSIPQTIGLAFRTPIGVVYHTADFRFDESPLDGQPSSAESVERRLGERPLLLLSDSTNVEVRGTTRSDREVSAALAPILADHPGRVFVTLFASNIARIQDVIDLSVRYDRPFVLSGRRIVANCEAARELGLMHWPDSERIAVERLERVDDSRATIVVTGSQGEANSELDRIAADRHKHITLREGDLIVFSSRVIPGNEREIFRLMNAISKRGARVLYERVAPVHGSGHACRGELEALLRTLAPRFFVPMHGEHRFLAEHVRLARSCGVEAAWLARNGDVFGVNSEGLRRLGTVDATPLFVRGNRIETADDALLRERRGLAYNGVLAAHLRIGGSPSKAATEIRLQSSGFLDANDPLLASAKRYLAETLELPAATAPDELESLIVAALRRFFRKAIGVKPVVLAFVDVDDRANAETVERNEEDEGRCTSNS
ncbi:MAG: ribonuclease J [Myxococcales bacterium]|nr:ribonuclease J [Myxococcales bacterium]